MRGSPSLWVRLRARILCGLAVPALLGSPGGSFGDELAPAPIEKPAVKKADALPLLACRQLALERAPALAAARASLAAAQAREQAVNHIGFASLISRDLPIRRQQAALGVSIGAAGLTQAEWDTLHGVTFSYLSAAYAKRQRVVANDAIDRLVQLRDIADSIIKEGKRTDVSKRNLDTINVYHLVAQGRREEAVTGEERALSALREAMGLEADCPLAVEIGDFKTAEPPPRNVVVAEAIGRRGELAQVTNAAQVTCLEVSAQQRVLGLRANTFAAASDIHAREVPQAQQTDVYRPGALGLEMPVLLPGCRGDRVQQAQAYYARTEAVVEKTYKLITLEAEQAYFRWQENSRKVVKLREAAGAANALSNDLRERFDPRVQGTVSMDDVLNAGVTAANTQLLANEVDYRRQLATAELERVTAGGFDPGWEQQPAANGDAEPQQKK